VQAVVEQVEKRLRDNSPDSRRLFHGRGGTFPGYESLTIDYFCPVIWIVLFDASLKEELGELAKAIRAMDASKPVSAILVQHRYLPGTPSDLLYGKLPEDTLAVEDSLRYEIKLGTNQNCGFFLDMANGRRWIRSNASGKRVLNLFSYTCAFSVCAGAGGAGSVVNIDMSKSALKTGRENHRLNHIDTPVRYLGHDIFRSWKKLRQLGPYELIIIDPPAFQKGSFIAENDYARLVRRLPELAAPGADILASLNAPYFGSEFLLDMFAETWPGARFVERIPNSADFPDINPESSLKLLRFKV
jgi:23S rRNA (cytosine1962-C5)-methyltransferase